MACVAMAASATVPCTPLALPAGSHHPVLSPDGSTLLFSTDAHTGLSAMNLADGSITCIDEGASAGFEPVFSTDGKTVYYRTAQVVDGLMYRDVRSYSFAESTPRMLAKHTRDKVELTAFAATEYAVADYATIKVIKDGKQANLRPLADSHSYLWASLSSDGASLLFSEPFKGVFVANADGTGARRLLPKGDFPSWAGKGRIVAVVSHDDGYQITDSKLVLVDIASGAVTDLTAPDVFVSEATASESGMVVFSDINGKMFTLDINKL